MALLTSLTTATTGKAVAVAAGLTLAGGSIALAGNAVSDQAKDDPSEIVAEQVDAEVEHRQDGEHRQDDENRDHGEGGPETAEDNGGDDEGRAGDVYSTLSDGAEPGDDDFGAQVAENAREGGQDFGQEVADTASDGASSEGRDTAEDASEGAGDQATEQEHRPDDAGPERGDEAPEADEADDRAHDRGDQDARPEDTPRGQG